ncbi:MAG: ferredoxin [bacterium]
MSDKISKVIVDADLCIGCGVCEGIAESEGYFKLVDGISEVEVDDYDNVDTDLIDQAINDCPVGAISKETEFDETI